MLTRIYGTAFFSKAELEEHLERIEQAKARDHRKLGRELGLFTFSEVSPGAAVLAAGGHERVERARRAVARGWAARAATARSRRRSIYDAELWKTSGHWGKYRENMFHVDVEGRQMGAQADELPRPRPALRR